MDKKLSLFDNFFNSMNLSGYINTDTVDFNLLWGDTLLINNGELRGNVIWNDTNSFQIGIRNILSLSHKTIDWVLP